MLAAMPDGAQLGMRSRCRLELRHHTRGVCKENMSRDLRLGRHGKQALHFSSSARCPTQARTLPPTVGFSSPPILRRKHQRFCWQGKLAVGAGSRFGSGTLLPSS